MPTVSVNDWEDRRRLFYRSMREKIWDYQRYARWYRSEFSEITYPVMGKDGKIKQAEVSPVNMTGLVGRSFISQLFFSAPETFVSEMMGFEGEQADKLAKVLTTVANDMTEKGGLFEEGSKCLLDGFLGPFMCMKIGYDADFTKDVEKTQKEQQRAEEALRRVLIGDRIRSGKDDNAKIFLDVFSTALAGVRRNEIRVTEDSKKYLETLVDRFRKRLEEEGPKEFEQLKSERVWFRRQAPDAVWFNLSAPDINSLEYIAYTTLKTLDDLEDNPANTIIPGETVPTGTSLESEENEDLIDERLRHYLQIDSRRPHFIQHEVIDLRNNEVVVYIQTMSKPVREAAYGFKDIMRNGASALCVMDEDPRLIVGIPQPKFWESQQIDTCILNTAELNTAKANVPGMAFDQEQFNPEEIEAVTTAVGNRYIGMKSLEKRSIKDVLMAIPQPEITPEMFRYKDQTMAFIDRLSGLGQVKLGGGDFSRTATASELIDQSASALSKRVGKKVDKFFTQIIAYGLRIVKAYYSTQTVANIAGPEALGVWPRWTPEQIVDDRGVKIKVETMREESTVVERKLMTDLYTAVVTNPLFGQTPALQSASMKLLAYLFRLFKAPIDLSSEIASVAQETAGAMAAGAEGGGGGAPTGEGGTRTTEVTTPVQNTTGGGRGGGGLGV